MTDRKYILMHNEHPVSIYDTLDEAELQKIRYLEMILRQMGPGEGIGKVYFRSAPVNKRF